MKLKKPLQPKSEKIKTFVEDSDLKIGGERAFELVDEIKLNRVLGDYFANSFHWNKG